MEGTLQERITLMVEDTTIGVVYKGTDNNSYGEITVLVGIHPDGTIAEVAIGATTNTPIFVNIIETDYLDPFTGMEVSDVTFDAKTGASYTYGSVEDIVRAASAHYDEERGASE
jgi:Na+-translocating ferredoxin:NAD+ oxidoreductase RnfG subunit